MSRILYLGFTDEELRWVIKALTIISKEGVKDADKIIEYIENAKKEKPFSGHQ